jgi:general L-amino acid transport system substrate-binding protein
MATTLRVRLPMLGHDRKEGSMGRLRTFAALGAIATLLLGACTSDDDSEEGADTTEAAGGDTTEAGGEDSGGESGDTLAAVEERGVVRCGTRDDLPGFATLDPSGEYVGFDSDFCRVIAAAVLGDAEAVEMVAVETDDRFTALQSGEIDVLVRNTTWTATRDGVEGATFLHPTFYDGQGMMVSSDSGITDLAGLAGGVVCAAGGTTSEGNIATEFTRLGLTLPEVLSFETVDLLQQAFQEGRCDGWSSDRSQLTGLRSTFPAGAEALTILDEIFSKEPLAPAVRDGDSAWAQAVDWAVLATIQAEELGITQANVQEQLQSTDPNVLRFLGVAVEGAVLDPGLGLPADFAVQVVTQVGNYGEIYDRNITPLGLERGLNELWTEGGLLYAPPYR